MKVIKIILLIILALILLLLVSVLTIYNLKSTGKAPDKSNFEAYSKRAMNFKDGKFFVPEKYYEISDSRKVTLGSKLSAEERIPKYNIPVVKSDLKTENKIDTYIDWLGHSSVFLQMEGKKILIDPIFSSNASPLPFGISRYSEVPIDLEALKDIDIVLLTHDHYDHLDYKTIMKIKDKVKIFAVPLGVESHLKRFGIDENKIVTFSWFEKKNFDGLEITLTPTIHHSGRFLNTRFTTLFGGYFLKDSRGFSIYDTGDGGYGSHFEEIYEKLGKADIIITDNGQYNEAWHNNHMFPEEAYEAAKIMKAKYQVPVHIAAYSLSPYPWNDALMRLKKIENEVTLITPKIGEMVNVKDIEKYREQWWIK